MEEFYMEADWPEKIARQEEILRYTTFTRKQALELGLCIAKLAEEKYKKGAAIRIIEDNTVIFEYKMETTNPENDWWMGKKLAVSLQTPTIPTFSTLFCFERTAPYVCNPERTGNFRQ